MSNLRFVLFLGAACFLLQSTYTEGATPPSSKPPPTTKPPPGPKPSPKSKPPPKPSSPPKVQPSPKSKPPPKSPKPPKPPKSPKPPPSPPKSPPSPFPPVELLPPRPPPQDGGADLSIYTTANSTQCVDIEEHYLNNGIMLDSQDCDDSALFQSYNINILGPDPILGELLSNFQLAVDSRYCWTAFGDKPDGVEDTAPPPSEYEDPYVDPWSEAKYWSTIGLWKCSADDETQQFIVSSSPYSPSGYFVRPFHARGKCVVASTSADSTLLQLVDCQSAASPPELYIPQLDELGLPGMVSTILDLPPPRPPRRPVAPQRAIPPSPPRPPRPPPPPPPPGQEVVIQTSPVMCVHLPNGAANNGVQLQQRKCDATSKSQKWKMITSPLGAWYYRITTIGNPTKCWALDNGMTASGTPLIINECDVTDSSQDFLVSPVITGGYSLQPSNALGMCIDVLGNATLSSALMGVLECTTNSTSPTGTAVGIDNFVHPTSIVSGDTVVIQTAAGGKCVHIPGGTPVHGIDLMQQSCVEGTKSQKFIAEAVDPAQDYYRIKSIDQKMCWFIGGLLSRNGSSVSMIECDYTDVTQVFHIPLTVEGWRLIKLQSVPGMCVSVKDLFSNMKSPLITWQCISKPGPGGEDVPQPNQVFKLVRI